MKEIISNAILFIVFGITFSALTACSGSQPATSAEQPAADAQPQKKSAYRPLPAVVAQSDIKNQDGTTFKLADRKGKVLLLNMWATWCGPCRAEMPTLVKLQEELGPQGFEVIGLNADEETSEQVKDFAAEMKLNYTLAWPDLALQKELLNISKFGGIPQSFLVDRDGNLNGVFKGANPRDVKIMEDLIRKVVAGEAVPVPDMHTDEKPAANSVPAQLPTDFDKESPGKPQKK